MQHKSFGELVTELRKEREWTVKDLIERLEKSGHKSVSPAYMTRIEQYGEIPSPDMILKLAEIFNYNHQTLLDTARAAKVKKLDKSLSEKYQKAFGHYRKSKET